LLLINLDLRPLVEHYAGWALDRRLSIGALRIVWGSPLSVEIENLRLANAPWGGEPDMLSLERAVAEIDLAPMLRGVLRYRKLHLVKTSILLERNADGVGNWRFGGSQMSGIALVQRTRGQFPTLLDFAASGLLRYRTTSGKDLRIDLQQMTIRAEDDNQPVKLNVVGAYNGVAAQLSGTTQSFAVLHDTATPFGADFSLLGDGTKIEFSGGITKPLDFDGVAGHARIDVDDLGKFTKLLGVEARAAVSLSLAGAFARSGDDWLLSEITGKLGRDTVGGKLALHEGARKTSDRLTLALEFPRLDLQRLLTAVRPPAPASRRPDFGSLSLRLDEGSGIVVDGRIRAAEAVFDRLHFADAVLQGRAGSGEIAVEQLSVVFAGGRIAASAAVRAAALASHVVVQLDFTGTDVGQLARMLGGATDEIAGKLDGGLRLQMTGATMLDALAKSHGQAVLAMTSGRVARALLERASTDLRALFRKGEGSAALLCLLGIVDLHDGIGKIAPLRLRTADTSLIGAGQVDLLRQRLDLIIEGEASGSLALNLPLRISGPIDDLGVSPALGSTTALDATHSPALQPDLQRLAAGNACLH